MCHIVQEGLAGGPSGMTANHLQTHSVVRDCVGARGEGGSHRKHWMESRSHVEIMLSSVP